MATETLRPEGAGSESAISDEFPDGEDHYTLVDEVEADDATTYVETPDVTDERDLYALPDSAVGAGTINSVTVHIKYLNAYHKIGGATSRTSIRTNGVTYDGAAQSGAGTWNTTSTEYTDNPQTTDPWTWAEVNALEAGVRLVGLGGALVRCTQVYVEVDYTPAVVPPVNPLISKPLVAKTIIRRTRIR